MLTLTTLEEAEKFVALQAAKGNDVCWDGWDIKFFRAAPNAIYSKNGAFRNGKWGYENTSAVDGEGTWHIDERNVRGTKRSRI